MDAWKVGVKGWNCSPLNIIVFKEVRPKEQGKPFNIPKMKRPSFGYSTITTQVIIKSSHKNDRPTIFSIGYSNSAKRKIYKK
jgi:hypothetical protein